MTDQATSATWELLNAIDVAAAAQSFRNAEGTPHLCIDEFLRPEFARRVAAAYPAYQEAGTQGKSYSVLHESGKVQLTDASRFPQPVAELNAALGSREFLETMVEIAGIEDLVADPELRGGGMHLMGSGARLDVHVDFNRFKQRGLHRRLNILVFLNPDWRPEWEGRFELWDAEVKHRIAAYTPVFNRCVFFATSEKSFHGVTRVSCPPGQSRRSFAAYYYTEAAPTDWAGRHSTIFRHRPGEEWRAILRLRELTSAALRSGARWLGRRLLGS